MTTTKFHVNPETGKSGPCRAGGGIRPRPCPFGGASGEENHYETPQEAKAAGEALLAARYGEVAVVSTSRTELADPTAKALDPAEAAIELVGSLGDLNPNVDKIGDNARYIEIISQLTDEDYRESLDDPIDIESLSLGANRENIIRGLESRIITSTVKDSYDYLREVSLSAASEQDRSEEIDFFVENYRSIQAKAKIRGIELPDIPEAKFRSASITSGEIAALKDRV